MRCKTTNALECYELILWFGLDGRNLDHHNLTFISEAQSNIVTMVDVNTTRNASRVC